MRRDLSYETDSGPKTKTVETWDLAYYFLSSYFMNLVHPEFRGQLLCAGAVLGACRLRYSAAK